MEDLQRIAETVSSSLLLTIGVFFGAVSFLFLLSYLVMPKLVEKIERDSAELLDLAKKHESRSTGQMRLAKIAIALANFSKKFGKITLRVNQWLTILAAVGGVIGMIAALLKRSELFNSLFKIGRLDWFSVEAFAQGNSKPELNIILPYVASFILILMGVAFLAALATLLVVKDTKDNQARIKAADNVVKTFGGFFTGLATTLLHGG